MDTTGLEGLEQILKAVGQRGGVMQVLHAQEQPRSLMERSGFSARLAAQTLAPQAPAAVSSSAHSASNGETPV